MISPALPMFMRHLVLHESCILQARGMGWASLTGVDGLGDVIVVAGQHEPNDGFGTNRCTRIFSLGAV